MQRYLAGIVAFPFLEHNFGRAVGIDLDNAELVHFFVVVLYSVRVINSIVTMRGVYDAGTVFEVMGVIAGLYIRAALLDVKNVRKANYGISRIRCGIYGLETAPAERKQHR